MIAKKDIATATINSFASPEEPVFTTITTEEWLTVQTRLDAQSRAINLLLDELEDLKRKRPSQLRLDQADVLTQVVAGNGGKMLLREARRKMHLPKNRFSEILAIAPRLETEPFYKDRREKLIILKSELVPRN